MVTIKDTVADVVALKKATVEDTKAEDSVVGTGPNVIGGLGVIDEEVIREFGVEEPEVEEIATEEIAEVERGMTAGEEAPVDEDAAE